MNLQRIFGRFLGFDRSSALRSGAASHRVQPKRGKKSRGLRLESLQKRELLASDLGAISGVAFIDADGDNTVDVGETLLQNVVVNLYLDDGAQVNGQFDGDETLVGSVTTGNDGSYRFTNLDGEDTVANDDAAEDLITTPTNTTADGLYVLNFTAGAGGVEDESGTTLTGVVLSDDISVQVTDDNGVTAVTVDNFQFDQPSQPISENTAGETTISQSGALNSSGGVLGDERDVQIILDTGTGDSSIFRVDTTAGNEFFTFQNGNVDASLLIQYDGLDSDDVSDDALDLDVTGLGGVDLTDGDSEAGLLFEIQGDQNATDGFEIRVFDINGNSAVFVHDIIANTLSTVFVAFDDFTLTGAMDFTDTGAIEVFVDGINSNGGAGATNIDVTVSVLESQKSTEFVANSSAGVPLFLGGEVFIDNGGGSNASNQNNGLRESGTEALATSPSGNEIIVQLFATDPQVGSPSPIATTTVQNQTGGAPGTYEFDTVGADPLGPGTYFVVIPASEFNSTGPLNGFIGSQVDTPAGDTDDDADDDNDGVFVDGLGFVSGAITLTIGGEPTGGNENTTVDFGVVPVTDLRIDKTILNDGGNPNDLSPGGSVRFTVTVTNLGVNDATDVVVRDLVPDGLTITNIQDSGGNNQTLTATIENGQEIRSFDVGTVVAGSGNAQSFTVIATIDSDILADPTNIVEVTGYEVEDDIDTTDADRTAGDPVQGATENNTAVEFVDIPLATLTVDKTDSLTTTTAGSQIIYTIVVTNTSADAASNVTALDTLPTGVTFDSGMVTVGDGTVAEVTTGVDTGKILATLGVLAAGASETFTITVDVDPDFDSANSPLSNSVTANADNASEVTNTDDTTITRLTDVTVSKVVLQTRTPDDRTDGDDTDDAIDMTDPFDVFAGGFVTYQITATNAGPSEARGVEVTDTLDSGLTLVANSFDALASGVAAPAINGQALTFTIPNLAPGQSRVFTFEVGVGSGEFDPIDNVVNITTTDPESDATNNSGTVSIDPAPRVDLILAKTVAPTTAVPGQDQVVYTFVVSHDTDSISDAINVDVTDTLPAGLTGVTIAEAGNDITNSAFNTTTRALLIEYASIPVGETRTFTVTADVNNDATGSIVNSAEVTVPGVTELDTNNNTDTATITLTPEFDLEVTKTVVGATTLGPLDNVSYTIVVSHDTDDDGTEADNGQSPSQATGVILTDVLPAGLTFTSATLGGADANATNTNGTLVFPSFDLAPGATRTYTINASVDDDAIGVLANSISFVTGTGETDTTNNSASADVTVVPEANVRVSKSVSTASAQSGTQLTYTITVNNDGPSPAETVTAVDTLPSGVTFVSGVGPAGEALSASGQTVTVNGGTLAASGTGSSFQFTIVAQVSDGVTVDQVNTVTVSTSTAESNANDNSASATTAIDQAINELSGTIFRDFNNDGLLNGIDTAIEGVELLLTGGDLSAAGRRAFTDDQGNYLFDDLVAGTYNVQRLNTPEYFNDGLEKAGSAATPEDLVNETIEVIVGGTAPASAPENDFALIPFISYKLCII